jgi:mycothiol system anti-sigma-R factor
MSNLDQSQSQSNCFDKKDCLEMLHMILDGEATAQQKEDFREHLDECMPCYQKYHLDMAIRELLKVKCCHEAPADLVNSIKNKININHNTSL